MGPLRRYASPLLLAGAFLASGLVVLSTLAFLARSHWVGPVGDFWLFLPQVRHFLEGGALWPILFEPHGGHRLVVPKLLYLAEYRFFAGTNFFLIGVSLAVQTASAALLMRAFWRDRHALVPGAAPFLLALTPALLFAASQLENFARGWNVHQFLCVGGAAAAFAALTRAGDARDPHRTAWLAAALAAAALAAFSMANGLLVPPLLVLLAWRTGLGLRCVGALAAAGLALTAAFAWSYPDAGASTAREALTAPAPLAFAVAAYLGAPLSWEHPTLGSLLGAAGVGLAGAVWAGAFWPGSAASRRRLAGIETLLLGLSLFCVGTAVLTSAGRIAMAADFWRAPRYQTSVLFFWLALFGLTACRGTLGAAGAQRGPLLAAGVSLWCVAVVLPAHWRESERMASFAARVRAANSAIQVGLSDREICHAALPKISLSPAHPNPVERMGPYLRRHRLGTFANAEHEWLGRTVGRDLAVSDRAACSGWIERTVRLDDTATRITGQVADRGFLRPSRLLIADPSGRVVGLGSQTHRKLSAALSGDMTSRWVGFMQPGVRPRHFEVWALLDEGSVCRVAGRT